MTQEEKELLLKDLCGRLPYGVIVKMNNPNYVPTKLTVVNIETELIELKTTRDVPVGTYKPYLRPMSSMTEKEKQEISKLLDVSIEIDSDGDIIYSSGSCFVPCSDYQIYIDYLNSHHFDYRGLIEKGLALEAPEGMYNI
jgi:hypothetical protein